MNEVYTDSYTEKVIDHFLHPRNMGEIENADGVGRVGNIACGDVMYIYIKIENDIIKDIKFKTYGCAAAIATSSILTEIAKGKSIDEAMKIRNDDVVKALGALPPIKIHCSLLAVDGLSEALYDYFTKKGLKISERLQKKHEMIVQREKKHSNLTPEDPSS